MLALAVALTTAATAGGCSASQDAHEHSFYVWSLAEILAALDAGQNLATGPSLVLPEGIAPSSIIEIRGDGTRALRVQPAFAEGKPAAYVTTDLWLNIPLVWLQPAYVLVQAPSVNAPPVPGAPMLIDVDQHSLFYSPFWNIRLAAVGPLADPNQYVSTRQLLDVRPPIPLLAGGFDNYPIAPVDFLPTPEGTHLQDPTFGFDLEDISVLDTRFDGHVTRLLDLGNGTFRVDASSLVESLPFFVFARRNSAGALVALTDLPRVAGVGPLGSNRPATLAPHPDTHIDEPLLGMLWTLVLVELPDGAQPFRAADHAGARTAAAAAGLNVRAFEGRVALDTSCFDQPSFPAACAWLDSQARIEGALGAPALTATEVNVNSTFVSLDQHEVDH